MSERALRDDVERVFGMDLSAIALALLNRIGMFAVGAGVGIAIAAQELLAAFCADGCLTGTVASAIAHLETIATVAVVGGVVCLVTATTASEVLD